MLHIASKLDLLQDVERRLEELFDRQHNDVSSREWTDGRYQGQHLTGLDCEVKEINIRHPVPVGSPVWTMKPLMFRWNGQPL